jgi:hypothetical protein
VYSATNVMRLPLWSVQCDRMISGASYGVEHVPSSTSKPTWIRSCEQGEFQ